jgi:ATP-binding cassette subfamily F protein 3
MLSDANFLLLDEPTNHLDIKSREQVEEALEEFAGTILVISHDRYFLDRIVERVVEVDNLGLRPYDGNFSYFWRAKKAAGTPAVVRRKKQRTVNQKKAVSRPLAAAQATRIEEKIQALETEKLRTEKEVVDAYNKRDYKRGERLSRRLRSVEREVEQLYEAWQQ